MAPRPSTRSWAWIVSVPVIVSPTTTGRIEHERAGDRAVAGLDELIDRDVVERVAALAAGQAAAVDRVERLRRRAGVAGAEGEVADGQGHG